MDKVHVIYGSTTGMTAALAERLAEDFGTRAINVAGADVAALEAEALLLGSSTWGCGELQDDWYGGLDLLGNVDLTGKKVAVFGCGDSVGFPDTFCDALAILAEKAVERGAELIGRLPGAAFPDVSSRCLQDGRLVGLAVDELNDQGGTAARLAAFEDAVRKDLA